MSYLLCDTAISTVKQYNAQQHYAVHKYNKYAKLKSESQTIALQKLKDRQLKQRQVFHSVLNKGNAKTKSSYEVAYLLGKKCKAVSDAELIKECIIEVVRCLVPDQVNKYKDVPFKKD